MTTPEREFDIVLYGASGFVGRLIADYLAGADEGARIALAGRSAARLQRVRDGLGDPARSWPLLVADASQPSLLADLAARTRVVATTVGPYHRYGLPLVAACVKAGTDYVDLTGEVPFIAESIAGYHRAASDTGARIVHSCGFDSIPSDLTVFALHRRAQRDGTGELGETVMVVRQFAGGVSGGTLSSLTGVLRAAAEDPRTRRLVADPYSLSPDRAAEPPDGGRPDARWRRGSAIAPELAGQWLGAFVMAPINTRIVRRSAALLEHAYGAGFAYSEQMSFGGSPVAPLLAVTTSGAVAAGTALGSRFLHRVPARLVEGVLPKPGSGPGERTRNNGHYTVETYTTTSTGDRYVARMAQRGDPGYRATSVLLGQSALALVRDRDRLSALRGVLTPAAAMGDALMARLPAAGVEFDVTRLA